MSRVSLLSEQMDIHCNQNEWFVSIKTALHGVTASEAAWLASEGNNTIWQIVNHLVFWNDYVIQSLTGNPNAIIPADNDETFGKPGDPADNTGWQKTVERFNEVMERMQQEVIKLDEASLDTRYREDSPPLHRLLSNIVMHDTYHVGQIVLLRKLHHSWTKFDWS